MVLKDGAVMSKSKGNVVDPDAMMQKYGADALRLYVMFVAPPEKEIEWTDAGIEGSFRFLARVWRLVDHWCETIAGEGIDSPDECESLNDAERALRRKTHDTIRRVTADIEERQQLNTAVSAMMELVNELYAFSERTATGGPGRRADEDVATVGVAERRETICVVREAVEALVRMLSPFAPHTAEEMWERLGHETARRHRDLAGLRRRRGEGRRDRGSGTGQRQGSQPADGVGGCVGAGARTPGARRSGRPDAHRRQDGQESGRGQRPPRVTRGAVGRVPRSGPAGHQ